MTDDDRISYEKYLEMDKGKCGKMVGIIFFELRRKYRNKKKRTHVLRDL